MKKKFFCFLFLFISIFINAQTIFGKWNTTNDDTGEVDSVIEIYEKGGRAFARVIEIKSKERQNAICSLCKGENKNRPILGLTIMKDLQKDGNVWSDGEIVDPRNGKVYSCYISLVNKNKLKIRGYIGFSILGKTKYWTRAH